LKIIWTPLFESDFQDLPKDVQSRAEKALRFLQDNPRHPSLRSKKMQGTRDIWEASVSASYRITFQITSDRLTLRQIGTHDILRKET